MKKTIAVLLSLSLGFMLIACGGGKSSSGKYSDVYAATERMAVIMEKFANDLEKSDSASKYAKTLTDYMESMVKIMPEVEALNEKYPELKNREEMPAEFKGLEERINKAAESVQANMMDRAMKYHSDPEVAQALQKLESLMSGSM